MGYFKIKNITTELGKRHVKVNSTQYIEIKSNFAGDRIALNPNGEVFIESNHLPFSVHKLRSEGLVSVVELDKNSYIKLRDAANPPKNNLTTTTSAQTIESKVVMEDKSKRTAQKFGKKDSE